MNSKSPDQRRVREKADAGAGLELGHVFHQLDLAVGFGEPLDRIADLNFQAGRDADLPRRLWLYNALLHHRYRVPVHSIVLLLRPAGLFAPGKSAVERV